MFEFQQNYYFVVVTDVIESFVWFLELTLGFLFSLSENGDSKIVICVKTSLVGAVVQKMSEFGEDTNELHPGWEAYWLVPGRVLSLSVSGQRAEDGSLARAYTGSLGYKQRPLSPRRERGAQAWAASINPSAAKTVVGVWRGDMPGELRLPSENVDLERGSDDIFGLPTLQTRGSIPGHPAECHNWNTGRSFPPPPHFS